MYRFSNRSLKNLQGIDAKLIILAGLMLNLSPYDFVLTEGLRTVERQKFLVKTGKSTTMNSKHIKGKAFDIAILVNGKITWEYKYYKAFADEFKKMAKFLNFNVTWGGDWKTFIDAPHFQLND